VAAGAGPGMESVRAGGWECDLLCTECETAGSLLCCDGPCLRSFHWECAQIEEADLGPNEPWLCGDCSRQVVRVGT
jgi:hypothetical protein